MTMTNEDAIKAINIAMAEVEWDYPMDYQVAFELAIKAIEKQIPRKPIYSDYDDNGFGDVIPYAAKCPVCGYEFDFGTWNENHHCICGQALSWGDCDEEG